MDVGNFILQNGPIVSTQEAGSVYFRSNNHDREGKIAPSSVTLYDTFSRHLNLIQIYVK